MLGLARTGGLRARRPRGKSEEHPLRTKPYRMLFVVIPAKTYHVILTLSTRTASIAESADAWAHMQSKMEWVTRHAIGLSGLARPVARRLGPHSACALDNRRLRPHADAHSSPSQRTKQRLLCTSNRVLRLCWLCSVWSVTATSL